VKIIEILPIQFLSILSLPLFFHHIRAVIN